VYTYKFTVLKIIDGDTVTGIIDLGLRISFKTNVRLANIDAPEIHTPEGPLVKTRLEELILGQLNVTVKTKSGDFDKYGRVLGTLYVGDVDVCQQLIDEKLVKSVK
jgi:micrococcal nuclease